MKICIEINPTDGVRTNALGSQLIIIRPEGGPLEFPQIKSELDCKTPHSYSHDWGGVLKPR
jgi:hypothetical protein